MTAILVLGALLLVVLVVAVLLFVSMRAGDRRHAEAMEHLAAQQDLAVSAAVSAAVTTTLAERHATADAMSRDRDQTVQAAVARASEVAEAKFTASLAAGSERLDARLSEGDLKLQAGTQHFAQQVEAVSGELKRVGDVVTALQKDNAQLRGEVVAELRQASQATSELKNTTGNLREVLASSKSRGQWGERMAEDILSRAGFVEGINYRQQKGIDGGGIPDFTFMMPRDLVLYMDVKFPIANYMKFLEAESAGNDAVAQRASTQFKKDVRQKIKELADRGYCEATTTVDYVVLFIPNESVYAFLHEQDPEIVDVGLRQKVVLCSPSTLFAVLAVIRQAVDVFMTERRGDEILEGLHSFTAEWRKFTEQLDKVGKQIGTLSNGFQALNGPRRNQLDRQIKQVSALREQRGLASAEATIEALPERPTSEFPDVDDVVDAEIVDTDPGIVDDIERESLFGTVDDSDRLFGSSSDSYPPLRQVSGGR